MARTPYSAPHRTRLRRALPGLGLLTALVALAACGSSPSAASGAAASGAPAPGASASPAPATPPAASASSPAAAPGNSAGAAAITALPALRLETVGTFEQPVWVAVAPGDTEHLFVVQKAGKVVVADRAGRTSPTPLLDLTGKVSMGGEQGLLSVAFSPRYQTDHLVYANYTDTSGDSHIVEYQVNGLAVDPASRRELLFVDQPYANHNGGLLVFDRTGMLLIGLGDGGGGGDPQKRAQNLGDLLGKILRVDARGRPYAIPKDNPFVARSGARGEVWAYGLRNPWRFAFDSVDNALFVGDVGQDKIEELDVVPAGQQSGANYGWARFEGRTTYNANRPLTNAGPLIDPVLTYPHSSGGCSITGGEVYRGAAMPALQGTYIYGDFCQGNLLGLRKGSSQPVALGLHVDALASFGKDADGELLVLSLAGTVSRLAPR